MRLIIAGGRDYELTPEDFAKLDRIHADKRVSKVLSGRATGVDTCGEEWARMNGIPVDPYPAPWDEIDGKPHWQIGYRTDGVSYWKLAGHARNERMAENADGVALFLGGHGTANMKKNADKFGLVIFDFRT